MTAKARYHPATRASEELAHYRAGELTFDQLVKLWSTRKYIPCPRAHTPQDAWMMDQLGQLGGGPGTWDEIESFLNQRKLTWAEYAAVSKAFDALHPKKAA